MTSFSKSARTTVRTCSTCHSKLETNGERTLTCEECADPTDALATQIGRCESVTVERGGVTLTKSMGIHDAQQCIEYSLTSSRSDQVRFRVQDHLPGTDGGATSTSDADVGTVDVTWWLPPEGELEFRRPISVGPMTKVPTDDHGIDVVPQFHVDGVDGTADVEVLQNEHVPLHEAAANGSAILSSEIHNNDTDDANRSLQSAATTGERDGADTNGTGSKKTNKKSDPTQNGASDDEGADGASGTNGPGRSTGILVAVPAYNEERAIGDVVSAAKPHADAVLVVDDGSEDETVARAWEAGAFVHRHETNKGYGATLQTIFSTANAVDAEHLVVLDGDGQHDPGDIPKLVERQRSTGAEIVIGSRFAAEDGASIPLYRRFGLAVINFLTNLSLGSVRSDRRIGDTQSGFRAYDRTAIDSLAGDDDIGDRMGVSYDILYHAHRREYDVAEVGTTVTYDDTATSSHDPISHGVMVLSNLVPVLERERPLVSLGIPGFALVVFGLGASVGLVDGFLASGNFDSIGILTSFAMTTVGFLVCIAGVVLHALHRFHEPVDIA